MALNLSEADKKRLERDLAAAEPYDENAPELRTFDGEVDFARMRATMPPLRQGPFPPAGGHPH